VIEREASELESSQLAIAEKENAKKLEGKIAVITGATEGIGFATIKLFPREGAYVFITGRHNELGEAMKAIGTNVSGVQGDVTQLADLGRLYQAVSKMKWANRYCFRQLSGNIPRSGVT
jgi:NAD(P)-dependent dehydrogenase (short-subunit alcohol dehydrogenase family)